MKELRAQQVRAEIDESTDKINGKIQRAEQMKVHTMFVIGKRDMEANAISVRVHGKGNLGAKPRAEVYCRHFAVHQRATRLIVRRDVLLCVRLIGLGNRRTCRSTSLRTFVGRLHQTLRKNNT